MSPNRSPLWADKLWADKMAEMYRCETYAVLVVDPATGEVDAHGPYDGLGATLRADQLRVELDADGLSDVVVGVSRLQLTGIPTPAEPTEPAEAA